MPNAMINTAANMTYGADNRLLTFNNVQAQYDADGNMIKGPISEGIITGDGTITASFQNDSQNRLIKAGNTTYTYDADNNRTAVNENGKTTSYVVNPQSSLSQVFVKTDADGKKTYYVYGLGLISEEKENGNYNLYHYDRRESTTAITDINGAVTDIFKYAPYAELVSRTGTMDTPFLFCGKYGVMTDNNGLYYMRTRYYNPIIKRFINADVLAGNIVDAGSLNRYAYVNGNPISYIDPFGLCADTDRAANGLKKIIAGVITTVVCVVAIVATVCTCGLDIPFLAGLGLLSSGCLAAMGYADTLEGSQDVIYGKYGLQDKSYNFVRDTVFLGNETSYFLAQIALGVISGAGAYKLAEYNSSKIIAAEMSNEVSNAVEGAAEAGSRISYSKYFESELKNFNKGYKIENVIDKDMTLVQFHSDAAVGSGRSLKFWTTAEEANKFSTIDEYMDKMALLSEWGERGTVSVSKIPAGTKVKYAIGTARGQANLVTGEVRNGGGLQMLFD